MAHEEDDDLYDEEFDFVDDDDDEEDLEDDEEASSDETDDTDIADEDSDEPAEAAAEAAPQDEEPVDEYGRPETPPANYVVHVYDQKKFSRTIDRPFTPEDAEAFATEFNRTSKNYGRIAITGKNDAKPKKALD
jgi:phage-related protein